MVGEWSSLTTQRVAAAADVVDAHVVKTWNVTSAMNLVILLENVASVLAMEGWEVVDAEARASGYRRSPSYGRRYLFWSANILS